MSVCMGPFAQLFIIVLASCVLLPLPALSDDIIVQRLDEEEAKVMQQQDVMSFDVVVYGGTPSGIMAAIAASRNGASAVVVEVTGRLGGMCAGGLGQTDIGDANAIGGLALDFFTLNGLYYNSTQPIWTLEPHVALEIFEEMLQNASVPVYYTQFVDTALMKGSQILSFTTLDGFNFTGKVFIDASYEGDLMARSNVTYTTGREAGSVYNEQLAGVVVPNHKNQFTVAVNPFDDDGNVLPLITPGPRGLPHQGDEKIQAYNFRLCVTNDASNRVPFAMPESYNPDDWELFRRMNAISPPTQVPSCNTSPLQNNKYDMNNCGAISSDLIGGSWAYPEANYSQRAVIWQQHKNYTQSLLWFLSSDLSVPLNIREEMVTWGLCADEFTETENWPPQLYVREARRMIGDSVFTQFNATSQPYLGNYSIGLGSYNFDSHNAQRYVCENSSDCFSGPYVGTCNIPTDQQMDCGYSQFEEECLAVGCCYSNTPVPTCFFANYTFYNQSFALNEGDVEVAPGLYEIPIGVLFPKKEECTNLLVPVSVSASHIGFATLRLEPQFMIMGQSAGTIAALSLQSTVQEVNVDVLHSALLEGNQKLCLSCHS